MIDRREAEWLSPFAARSAESAGREREESPDPVRTHFQRDRDRIVHSKSFRRLKYKTQVFISPSGDHFRTRLTHSLEVSQVARTIGRALRLNEDLIEAIALGHDVGHTPFGHAGESALDEAIRELVGEPHGFGKCEQAGPAPPTCFRHYEQSLRVVDHLDRLNLTLETREGIGGHSKGRSDLTAFDGEPVSTLEAAVVRVSDRIAYLNHDVDDALRSGIVKQIPSRFEALGATSGRRIGAMVENVIVNSLDRPAVAFSPEMLGYLNDLKEWLFENVYLRYPEIYPDTIKAQRLIKELFRHYATEGALPEGFSGVRGAIDYVAGMTDRFAIATYARLRLPASFRAGD